MYHLFTGNDPTIKSKLEAADAIFKVQVAEYISTLPANDEPTVMEKLIAMLKLSDSPVDSFFSPMLTQLDLDPKVNAFVKMAVVVLSTTSRHLGIAAYEAPLALVDARVAALEAASVGHLRDDDEATFVSAGLRLTGEQVNAFILNLKVAGKVQPGDYDSLEPSAKIELNELEFARWRAHLLEGGFSTDAAQKTPTIFQNGGDVLKLGARC